MIFVDTPLDICMARRILRDFTDESSFPELIQSLRGYLNGNRNAYLEMDKNVKSHSDYVLDGKLSVDTLADNVFEILLKFFS